MPYPAALSAKTRAAELSATGVESAVWLFSMQKMAGSFRAAHTLMASCHSPSDEPPSPMNDTATRSAPSRQKAMASPAMVSDPMASGAVAGSTPQAKSPVCRSLPCMGGPSLPICAVKMLRTASASCRMARATPMSRMTGATTSPCQAPSSPRNLGPRFRRMPAA